MTGIFYAAIATVAVIVVLMAYRMFKGPTVFDRLTGLGVAGTNTILLLLLIGRVLDRTDMFVDISLAYALIGFVTFVVVAKYFERKGEAD